MVLQVMQATFFPLVSYYTTNIFLEGKKLEVTKLSQAHLFVE